MSKYIVTEIPRIEDEPRHLKVATYCRVSTSYEEQEQSLENQIEFYAAYIQKHPSWDFAGIYFDKASWVRTKRSGYRNLLKDCDQRKIDLILVKSLSRFGRDTAEIIKQVRRLKKMNIGIQIETGGFNTLDMLDSIIDQYAAICLAESQSLSDNIKFGIRQRMKMRNTLAKC